MNANPRKLAEEAAFEDARLAPDKAESLEAMMRLALHATAPARRLWARQWLFEHCGVRVVEDGPVHKVPTPSNDLF